MGYLNNSGLTRFWNAIKSKFIRTINGIGPDANGNVSVDTCEFINGTQTAATGSFTGVSRDTSLYDGKHIIYRLPYAGSGNATLNLTLADGTTTGAKNVWRAPGTRLTTHYAAGNFIGMTYFQSDDSWHCDVDVDTDSYAYGVRLYYSIYKAKTALYRYQIVLTRDENTVLPVNAVDNNVGTTKQLTTDEFDPFGEIYWYWTTTTISAGSYVAGSNLLSQYWLVDLRYSFNTGATLTAYKDVYLVCEPRPNGKAVLAPNPISQTLPSSEDGYVYIRLGKAYDTYRITLDLHKPRYYYANGEIREWTNAPMDAKLAEYNTDEDVFQIRHAKAEKPSYNSEVVRKITGGTLAWNQLIQNGNFESTNNWRVYTPANGQLAASDNVMTITYSVEGTGGYAFGLIYTGTMQVQAGHKYLLKASVNPNFDTKIDFELGTGIEHARSAQINSWTDMSVVVQRPSWSQGNSIIIKPVFSSIVVGSTLKVRNFQVFDLTQTFGSTIADRIYALEQATAGAGVAWFRRYFNRDYYEPAQTLAHTYFDQYETTGFNLWDEEVVMGYFVGGYWYTDTVHIASKYPIAVMPNTTYYLKCSSPAYVTYWKNPVMSGSSNTEEFISRTSDVGGYTFTTPSNCRAIHINLGEAYGATYKHDVCINLSDASRNGQYEPYRYSRITFFDDPVLLRGTPYLDENDNLRFNGDTLEATGKLTRRYGVVDLGTLNWTYVTTGSSVAPYFYANTSSFPQGNIKFVGNSWDVVYPIICSKYTSVIRNQTYFVDKTITADNDGGVVAQIQVKDSAYTDAATFKTAMNGVYLVYELATPTEEEFTPIDGPLVSDPLGLEVIAKSDWDDTPILAQMDILYANEVRANVEMIATNKVIASRNSGDNSSGIYYGTCSTDAATAEKAVVCEDFDITKLVPGAMITVKFLNTNSAAVGNLTLNVNFTVAKGIRYVYNGSYSTIPGAGYLKENQIYQFTYDGTYWVVQMMYNTDTAPNRLYLSDAKRKVYTNLYRYQVCFTKDEEYILPANAVDNSTATTKQLTTESFDPFGPIFFYSSTTTVAANGLVASSTLYFATTACDLRYSFNTGTSLTANKHVYLKCQPQSNGKVKMATTNPIVQALPTTEDGYVYILLGVAYDTYRICFFATKPIYHCVNGEIREWTKAPYIPAGGSANQVLKKLSADDYDYDWETLDIHNVPSGGSKDQVLTKNSATNYDFSWKTPANTGLPTGGSLGQVLAKKSATNYDTEWINPPSGVKIYNITYNSSTHTYALPDTFANVRNQFLAGNIVILSSGGGTLYYLSEASANTLVFTSAVTDDYFVYRLEWLSSDTAISEEIEISLYNNYVPSGGTTGQFLVKKSNTNFDLQWVTVPNANGVSF